MPSQTAQKWSEISKQCDVPWNLWDSVVSVDGSKVFPLLYSWHDLAKIVIDHCLEVGLDIPNPVLLPSDDSYEPFPHFFVRNEAFPLKKYLMCLYPQRVLTYKKHIFHCTVSWSQKSLECAYGMLASKFCIFKGPVCCYERTVIQAACILLDFILIRERKFF
jgi:hypothetical protein